MTHPNRLLLGDENKLTRLLFIKCVCFSRSCWRFYHLLHCSSAYVVGKISQEWKKDVKRLKEKKSLVDCSLLRWFLVCWYHVQVLLLFQKAGTFIMSLQQNFSHSRFTSLVCSKWQSTNIMFTDISCTTLHGNLHISRHPINWFSSSNKTSLVVIVKTWVIKLCMWQTIILKRNQ